MSQSCTLPRIFFFFGAGWKRVSAFCWASIGWTGAVETGWGKTKKEHYQSFDVDREEFIGLTVSSSIRGAAERKCPVGEASGRAPSDSSGSTGKSRKTHTFLTDSLSRFLVLFTLRTTGWCTRNTIRLRERGWCYVSSPIHLPIINSQDFYIPPGDFGVAAP